MFNLSLVTCWRDNCSFTFLRVSGETSGSYYSQLCVHHSVVWGAQYMAFLIDRNTADQRRQYDGYVAWIGINISSLYLFVIGLQPNSEIRIPTTSAHSLIQCYVTICLCVHFAVTSKECRDHETRSCQY